MPDSMIDTQLQGAMCRQLGIPCASSGSQLALDFDVFSPSHANLFVVIDGLTSEELSLHQEDLSHPIPIRSSYFPSASASSLLATVLTGKTPRIHGIIADKWDYLGETEHAYVHAYPGAAQVADILVQATSGRSRVISASASPIFARALSVRTSLIQYAQQSIATHFNTNTRMAQPLEGFNFPPLSQQDLIELLQSHFRDLVLIDTEEHKTLYAELALILKSVSDLHTRAQVSTSPDLFNFAISALNPIRTLHSKDSSEYTSAVALVRQVLLRAMDKIQRAYGTESTSFQILCIKSTRKESELIPKVASLISGTPKIEEFFPNIYTPDDRDCQILAASGIQVFCPNSFQSRIQAQNNWLSYYSTKFERTIIVGGTEQETVAFWHMFMFTWIAFIVMVLIVWYCLYNMDIGEDSLLYRMTAIPNGDSAHVHYKDQ